MTRLKLVTNNPVAKPQRPGHPDPVLRAFKQAWSQSHMTKAQLVRSSGVSYSTLRNWETGKTRSPLFSTMRAALTAMGCEIVVQRKGD